MKNIQVIDGALNCTYSTYAATQEEFEMIFPEGRDIEFDDDLVARLGEKEAASILGRIWDRLVDKKDARGIHGTLFFEWGHQKKYYPTKEDDEMIVSFE